MKILFKPDFKEASNNCWKCKIYDEEKEERDMYFRQANNTLTRIINDCEGIISNNNLSSKTYEDAVETKKIAKRAQEGCKYCKEHGYIDTKIKNHLEVYGIKSD